MIQKRTGHRVVFIAVSLAAWQLATVGLFLGPMNVDVFFTEELAHEMSAMSENLLARLAATGQTQIMLERDSRSAEVVESSSDAFEDVRVYMRELGVCYCYADTRCGAVVWTFLAAHREFISYVYMPNPGNGHDVAEMLHLGVKAKQAGANWQMYVH